jgi:quinol monooxygenase YgiN
VPILQIEHAISDFFSWKRAFDADPVRRAESGVRRYRVFRPVDDPNYIKVDLEFNSTSEAEAFRAALQALWGSGRAAPALAGSPQARIVEEVQSEEYAAG